MATGLSLLMEHGRCMDKQGDGSVRISDLCMPSLLHQCHFDAAPALSANQQQEERAARQRGEQQWKEKQAAAREAKLRAWKVAVDAALQRRHTDDVGAVFLERRETARAGPDFGQLESVLTKEDASLIEHFVHWVQVRSLASENALATHDALADRCVPSRPRRSTYPARAREVSVRTEFVASFSPWARSSRVPFSWRTPSLA